jgi:hypothetical protein
MQAEWQEHYKIPSLKVMPKLIRISVAQSEVLPLHQIKLFKSTRQRGRKKLDNQMYR